ncbi:CBS domain-containing protein [Bacillus andreraoultii]|uniref:CBS domain-containing protein n=1 Tax=Bacillus andreraoultii TaxID=1499685 RepID=UPI000539F5C5|nr:CBS domain-containing protein [Bacillus andreraoultii]
MRKIKDLMTTELETCTLLDNVYEVSVKMKEADVGAIPVVDQDRIIGIITDRDLVLRGYAEKRPGSTKVEDVMTKNLITVTTDDQVYKAAKLMAEHKIRRLPVVDDGYRLIGMISLGDIAVNENTDYQAKTALAEISEDHSSEKYMN